MILALAFAARDGGLSPELVGAFWTFLGTAALAGLGWIGTVIVKRVRLRASEPEMWKRLDQLTATVYGGHDTDGKLQPGLLSRLTHAEETIRIQGSILRAVADQGPSAGFFPRLDPTLLAEIDQKILAHDHPWRRKP